MTDAIIPCVVTRELRSQAEAIGVDLADALFGRWLAEDPTWRADRMHAHEDLRVSTKALATDPDIAFHLHAIAFNRYCQRSAAHMERWDHQQEIAFEAENRSTDRRLFAPRRRVAR